MTDHNPHPRPVIAWHLRRPGIGLATLLLSATCLQADVERTFLLAPASAAEPVEKSSLLSSGRVFLYGAGDDEPRHILPANTKQVVPAGQWRWVAESDEGYVSVEPGTIGLSDDASAGRAESLLLKLVEACRLDLDPSADWDGVARLDVVSPGYAAVFPIDPKRRASMWVPTGELVAYSVGRGGIRGIDHLGVCGHRDERTIGPPAPPKPDAQEFMVHLVVPEGHTIDEAFLDNLAVGLNRAGSAPVQAVTSFWVRQRGTFFFLDVPADAHALVVRHTKLRTYRRPIAAAGGTARELAPVLLKDRRSLDVTVDYLPARRHWEQTLDLFYCGESRQLTRYGAKACKAPAGTVELMEGANTYTFPYLDDGLYIVSATVDDENVHGLGVGLFPFLDPGLDEAPVLDPAALWEQHIFGSILDEHGDAVPGYVQLVPIDNDQPPRVFSTNEDLIYNLYYFGGQPFANFLLEGDEERAPEEKLGLYYFYRLRACDLDGTCRLFHSHSQLRGSGRLDLPLGAEPHLAVRVADGETGKGVTGARVLVAGAPGKRLVFADGEATFEDTSGEDPNEQLTDSSGTVTFREVPEGPHPVVVSKRGYKPEQTDARVRATGTTELNVLLWPEEDEDKEGLQVHFPGGAPASDVFFLVVDANGDRSGCSFVSDHDGIAMIPDGCVETADVAVMHPGVRLEVIRGDHLRRLEKLEVQPAPLPLRIRVVDENGAALNGVPIELRFDGLTLSPNDFLLALRRTGHLMAFRTDASGVATLHGVDPRTRTVPDAAVAHFDGPGVALGGRTPGEVVELVVSLEE